MIVRHRAPKNSSGNFSISNCERLVCGAAGRVRESGTLSEQNRPGTESGPDLRWSSRIAILALAVAAVARFIFLDRIAVEHFDEGVYSSDFWFVPATGHRYPLQLLFAPPFFPWLQQHCMELLGISATSVFGVNLLAGWLTVFCTWWFSRRWFGPTAALVSVVLAATCDIHILFSRTALTDPLHLLFFLLAVCCSVEFLKSGSGRWGWIVAAGVMGGLAFSTKYTGWLAAPVLAGSGVLCRLRNPGSKTSWVRIGVGTAVAVGVAALVWSPVYRELQSLGGYQVVQENHSTYFRGASSWWGGLTQQLGFQRLAESWMGVVAAVAVCVVGAAGFTWNKSEAPTGSRKWAMGIAALPLLMIWPGPSLATLGLAVSAVVVAVVGLRSRQPSDSAIWALGLWLLGMLVAVPAYTPYPRLTLLWLPPIWMLAGMVVARLSGDSLAFPESQSSENGTGSAISDRKLTVLAVAICVLLGIAARSPLHRDALAWQERTGTEAAVAETVEALKLGIGKGGGDPVVQTLGEPAAMFHLLANEAAGVPAPDLPSWLGAPSPQLLMVGAYLADDDQKRLDEAEAAGRIQRISEVTLRVSELQVWNLEPGERLDNSAADSRALIVYQHRAPGSNPQ